MAWAQGDGFAEARDAMYASSSELAAARAENASLWVSRGAGRTPIQPFWGQVEPLSLNAPESCHVPFDIPFDLTPGSTFHAQLMEVYRTSQTLSEDQVEAAYFWDDEPVETGTIGGHFLMIATLMTEERELSLNDAALVYALLGTALHDAFVCSLVVEIRGHAGAPGNGLSARGWTLAGDPFCKRRTFPNTLRVTRWSGRRRPKS